MRSIRPICLLATGLLVSTPIVHAQTVVSTTPLGPVPTTPTQSRYYVSPDGQHVAIDKPSGSRRVISVDGVDGEQFDSMGRPMDTPGSKAKPQVAQAIVFSPDGNRVAYPIQRAGKDLVVVDNTHYDFGSGSSFLFSPDSKRFAYIATRKSIQTPRKSIIVDGVNVQDLDEVKGEALYFSANSQHIGYIAFSKGEWRVTVDGTPGPPFQEIQNFQFDPTGTRFAYLGRKTVGKNDTMWVPVVDGTALDFPSYMPNLTGGTLTFSPDGTHWAYIAQDKTQHQRLVADGVPGEMYGLIEQVRFSPDSTRLGYIANLSVGVDLFQAPRIIAIVDGQQLGMEYQKLQDLQFSPDSRHVSVKATQNGAHHLVMNGEESEGYQEISDFTFSATGRYAYIGRQANRKRQVIIDGRPEKEIDELAKGSLMFSPDGSRLFYGAHTGMRSAVTYFDGKEEAVMLEVQQSPTQWKQAAAFSPDGQHIAFMGKGTGQPTLFVDWMPGAEGLQYAFPVFSDDGRHLAVPARNVKNQALKWAMYLNGKPVFEFNDVPGAPSPIPHASTPVTTWKFLENGHLQAVVIKDHQFQRIVVDPESSTLEAFAGNMAQVAGPTMAKPVTKLPTGTPPSPIEVLQGGAKKILDMFGTK